jgi:hypothetical protein
VQEEETKETGMDPENKDTPHTGQQPESKPEYTPPRFMELVLSVGAGALQALGMGLESGGKESEPNLDLARYSIDLLELLEGKTKGNLEEEEERFLTEMLHQLRLKYLEVANKTKEA